MSNLQLEEKDRTELLRIARTTLREHLATGYLPPGSPHRKTLLQPAGAFVTIYVDGQLRGCMGRVDAEQPLYLTVEELTVAAATRDPRFDPVRLEELKGARIAVSVLTPPVATRPEEIVIGRDGLVITRGPRRGLLLPQVATEHSFTVEQFLDETCKKASLPAGAWREPGTTVERFTADVFEETETK